MFTFVLLCYFGGVSNMKFSNCVHQINGAVDICVLGLQARDDYGWRNSNRMFFLQLSTDFFPMLA